MVDGLLSTVKFNLGSLSSVFYEYAFQADPWKEYSWRLTRHLCYIF